MQPDASGRGQQPSSSSSASLKGGRAAQASEVGPFGARTGVDAASWSGRWLRHRLDSGVLGGMDHGRRRIDAHGVGQAAAHLLAARASSATTDKASRLPSR